ncbi:MAG: hypothetical protein DK303_000604 [Chloroflexi bacterium]|nr:MAG: hypothetical protein DK303_000604 [Chloroflexota bacterium]
MSRCFNIVSADPTSPNAQYDGSIYPKIDSVVIAIPPDSEPIIDPRDTYLVNNVNGKNETQAIKPDQGDRTIRADKPEATPFPPRKFVNTGHICPKIEASPIIGCSQLGIPKS